MIEIIAERDKMKTDIEKYKDFWEHHKKFHESRSTIVVEKYNKNNILPNQRSGQELMQSDYN